MKIFGIGFILNYPSKDGREVDFRDKIDQIEDAIRLFNAKYKRVKREKEIKLFKLERQEMHLFFKINDEDDNFKMDGRHLSFFSKRLYEMGWNNYSSVETKLFKTSYLKDVTEEYDEEKYKAIPIIPNNINRGLSYDEDLVSISNDQAFILFKNLCDTQDIGDEVTKNRNKEALNSIKSILFNWFK